MAVSMIKTAKDVQTILPYFSKNPYPKIQDSCVVCHLADQSVDVDRLGKLYRNMCMANRWQSTFRKKNLGTTLATSTYIIVVGERLEIDPKQLLQCLVVAGKDSVDTLILFTYELSS